MMKTYHGSCHCGAVRFECELDLAKGPTSKCNCSICTKGRFWKTVIKADAFRLLHGQQTLAEYSFGRGVIHHFFCRHCGIKPFGRGHMEEMGGTFYGVNLACLDDATPQELAAAPVHCEDGRHDDWSKAPAETRYL
jgi:hypothetical protein